MNAVLDYLAAIPHFLAALPHLLVSLAFLIVDVAAALTIVFLALGWSLRHVADGFLHFAIEMAKVRRKFRALRTRESNQAGLVSDAD